MKWKRFCCVFSTIDEKKRPKVAKYALLLYEKLYKIEQFGKK
jgi:hypothetical protein